MPFWGLYDLSATQQFDTRVRGVQPLALYPKGRRIRVLARLKPTIYAGQTLYDVMAAAEALRGVSDPYATIPLRTEFRSLATLTAIPIGIAPSRAPQAGMHHALRDMAYEILEDIQEACWGLDDPDIWYPGVDEGIEPVDDEHVKLVMWAMQRELDREVRPPRNPDGTNVYGTAERLPPVQLATLPWRIQRALAERRRLRFKQWGIGKREWERNEWSLWNVPLDPEYQSRREARGLDEVNDARIMPPG